jgi:hypothetical protein
MTKRSLLVHLGLFKIDDVGNRLEGAAPVPGVFRAVVEWRKNSDSLAGGSVFVGMIGRI